MLEELTEFSKRLEVESNNGPVDLSNNLNVMLINVLWRIVGVHRFDYDDEKFAHIVKCLNQGFSAIAPLPK